MKQETNKLVRQLLNLDAAKMERVRETSDNDLPAVLEELGVTVPSMNWFTILLKVVLYAVGLVLAGMGTATAATMVTL